VCATDDKKKKRGGGESLKIIIIKKTRFDTCLYYVVCVCVCYERRNSLVDNTRKYVLYGCAEARSLVDRRTRAVSGGSQTAEMYNTKNATLKVRSISHQVFRIQILKSNPIESNKLDYLLHNVFCLHFNSAQLPWIIFVRKLYFIANAHSI